ncbi:MAG: VWA domain-containing protein, partial [Bacteroidetes bacterium]|nr:VWA domain-containing protein [Bacteroidota bacterium]
MMRLKGFAALLLLAVLLGSTASAQFSLTVDTVMTDDFPNIKVNVTTRYSGVVTRSIDSSHFRLMEDGFVQEPLHFSCPDPTESFSLAIVLGIGSSMSAGDIGFAKGVASRITEGMNGISDEVAVLTYDDNVNLQVEFTHIPVVVQQRVDAITPSGRGNYFWDGVWEAVRYCANDGSRMSRGVLVLSNGKGDGGSKTINDVVQLAKLAKLPVYCLGISAVGSDQDMRDLAAQTGGRYFDNADQTVRELVDALNGTPPWCTLEYTTNHHCRSGVDREISIRVREDNDSASVTHTFPLAADPADRVPVTMQVDTGTVIAGKTTDVPLLLTPAVQNQRLVNGELVLLFDTSLVRLTGARTDGYLAEGMQASVRQAQDGAVVELMGAAKLNGSGPMMMLQFTGGIVTAPTPVVVNIDTLTGQQETCLDRAYPSSTLTIVPKRASIRTTAQPVVFTWDSGAKRYTPHPGILTVEVTNDGDLPVTNLTATLDENTDLRMAYGGSRSVAVNPPSLEPGKKGTAVWYVQVLPQSTERTAQVDAVITSDEGATATQRLFVNIKPAESAFALQCDADDITVSGGAYTPDPAEVRAVVTAAGTMDGPAGEVTIVLPPELTLESGDATQPFASMAPGNSETLAWTVQYPEREEDYNILLIATAAGYPSDTCRVTLRVPPKLSAQF